jgi:hypothetical protein
MFQELYDELMTSLHLKTFPFGVKFYHTLKRGFPQMPDYTLTDWAVNYRKAK